VTSDTWIDEARQAEAHGADSRLSVVGGADERRMLLSFPPMDAGAGLPTRVVLQLELVANADLTRASRELRVFSLLAGFDEATATWRRSRVGASGQWATEGGDAGVASATALVPGDAAMVTVAFDVTEVLADALGEAPSFLVLESGAAPAPPAELEFAARESEGGGAWLELEYCPP
jgi:hypothetical protein